MVPGRRGPNRVGPDLLWRRALSHGVLAYFLICRVVSQYFELAIDDARDAFFLASCFTKELDEDQTRRLA